MTNDMEFKVSSPVEKLDLQAKNKFEVEDISSLSLNSDLTTKIENSHENDHTQVKYPKHVLLIILNQFCERFSYFGIRTVLFIFLTSNYI
jgi:hypothetical protein